MLVGEWIIFISSKEVLLPAFMCLPVEFWRNNSKRYQHILNEILENADDATRNKWLDFCWCSSSMEFFITKGKLTAWRRSVMSGCFIMMDSVSPQSRTSVHGLDSGSDWESWLWVGSHATLVSTYRCRCQLKPSSGDDAHCRTARVENTLVFWIIVTPM